MHLSGAAAALVAAGILMVQAATATAGDQPVGDFRGAHIFRDRPVPVHMKFVAGGRPGRIEFAEPWVCGLDLLFTGFQNGAAVYAFAGVGSGHCLSYAGGRASVQAAGSGIDVTLVRRSAETDGPMRLNRVTSAR